MSQPRVAAMSIGLGLMAACTAAVPYSSSESPARPATEGTRRIDWNQAIALLRSGRVLAVIQLHDLGVTLTTDDGKRHATTEPTIDAILSAIALNAPNAQSIVVATE